MKQAPIPGTPYAFTVSVPSNFHKRNANSRFHVIFIRENGPKWIFSLRRPVKIEGRVVRYVEAMPNKIDEPLDVEKMVNVALLRFTADESDTGKEWLIATVVPDLKHEAPVPFWPPWKNLAQTA